MSKTCENLYKLCREGASLTQEQAAHALHVAVRTLSEYENGRAKVPDETVAIMETVYKCPWIGLAHLKNGPLGHVLPDVKKLENTGGLALHLWTIREILVPAVNKALKVLSGHALGDYLSDEDIETLNKIMSEDFEKAREMIVSAKCYSESLAIGKKPGTK